MTSNCIEGSLKTQEEKKLSIYQGIDLSGKVWFNLIGC